MQTTPIDEINEKPKPKWLIVVLITIVVILLVGGITLIFKATKGGSKSKITPTVTPFLPPADPRIVVSLEPKDKGKTVLLAISNYPDDVYSIEYELTYKSDKKQEGVFGTIKLAQGEKTVTRELTLGTCSSGRCVYHNLVENKGTLTIKFTAKSGASRFQKEFALL